MGLSALLFTRLLQNREKQYIIISGKPDQCIDTSVDDLSPISRQILQLSGQMKFKPKQKSTLKGDIYLENKIFKPKIDRLFYIIWVPTVLLLLAATVITCFDLFPLLLMLSVDIFTLYFLVSPLIGYVELRQETMFIKYGFILKKEIPYTKIRDVKKERKFYSESMISLKNAIEHVNIKYNNFDVTTVSVKDNDAFIIELKSRINAAQCDTGA